MNNNDHNLEPQDPELTELEITQQKAQEYLEGWKRAQADYTNLKKDEAKRVQEVIQFANEALILEMIDILDNLYMTVLHAPEIVTKDLWFKGLQQTAKHFEVVLQKHGIERVKSIGEDFNPLFHEAIEIGVTKPPDGEGVQKIASEQRAGYTMHGKVIRPARVALQ